MSGRLLALLIAALAFLELALLYLAVPLVPHWRAQFGLSGLSEGIALGAYSGAIALLSLPFGVLVDRVGARAVTLASTVAAVAATPLIAFANGALELVAVRFLQGAFAAGVWTAGLAWIAAVIEPAERARAIGRVEGAAVVGSFVGPLLGGPVVVAVGLRDVAFALAILALALLVVLLLVPSGMQQIEAESDATTPGKPLLLQAGLFMIVATSAATAAIALIAPLMLTRDGLGGTSIGGLFAGGAAVAALASAGSTRHLPLSPRTAAMLVATIGAVAAAGALGGGSAVFAGSDVILAVSLQAVGFGYAFALVASGAPPDRRGRALAVANTLGASAGLLMPAGAGALADWGATPRIGLLAPAIVAFAAATLLSVRRREFDQRAFELGREADTVFTASTSTAAASGCCEIEIAAGSARENSASDEERGRLGCAVRSGAGDRQRNGHCPAPVILDEGVPISTCVSCWLPAPSPPFAKRRGRLDQNAAAKCG